MQSDLYYYLGSGSATSLLGATLYNDALGLNVLPSNFYKVAGGATNSSINIAGSSGVVTTGKTACAACGPVARDPALIYKNGPSPNGSWSSSAAACGDTGATETVYLIKGPNAVYQTGGVLEIGDLVMAFPTGNSSGTAIGVGIWYKADEAANTGSGTEPAAFVTQFQGTINGTTGPMVSSISTCA